MPVPHKFIHVVLLPFSRQQELWQKRARGELESRSERSWLNVSTVFEAPLLFLQVPDVK